MKIGEPRWLRRVLLLATLALWGCASVSSGGGSDAGGTGGSKGQGTGGASAGTGGSSTSATGGTTGSSGGSSSTGGAATGGSSGAGGSSAGGSSTPGCAVAIELVSPTSLADVVVGPAAHVTLKARLVTGTPAATTWTWAASRTLLSGGAFQNVDVVAQDDDRSTVSLLTDVAGHYAITAIRGCQTNFYFDAGPPTLRWVVQPPVPPASGSNVPARELRLTAADVMAAGTLDVGQATPATIAPADPSGAIVPSYVRLTTSALAGWSLEGSTTGPWNVALLPNVTYDVLIIPSAGNTYAPRALSLTPDHFGQSQPLLAGRALSVEARDEQGKPWSGVRALLGSGTLPSTLGTTTDTGVIPVRLSDAADRTWIASLSAPSDQGRYGLRTAALDLTNATRLVGAWTAHGRNPLTITALDPSGARVVGARVRLATQAPFPKAATVTIVRSDGSSTVLDTAGTFTADAVTSAAGVATFPSVPADTFTATIYPDNGSGPSPWAITTAKVVASATTTAQTVPLRARVSFAGTARIGASCPPTPSMESPCAGLSIVAHQDQEEVDPSATIAADGSFTLPLDPALSYELIARPGPQQVAPQTVLGTISPADATAPKVFQLPTVSKVSTTVRAGGQAVAGAWVRVYCLIGSARCADPTLPIAEGRSDDQGRIVLPLPASF